MPYTTWGWMPQSEVDEIEADMDLGAVTIQLDDPPEWFERSHPIKSCDEAHPDMDVACIPYGGHGGACPVCDKPLRSHESVTVMRASDKIVACIDPDGEAHELPQDDEGVMYA